VAEERYVIG